MSTLLDPAVARALGLGLLHSLWQGTLIALALALSLRAIDRRAAALRHALAWVALLAMVALPAITAWASYRPIAPMPAHVAITPHAVPEAVSLGAADAAPAADLEQRHGFELPDAPLNVLALVWLAGVLVSAARLLKDAVGAQRLAGRAAAAPEGWQIRLDRLSRRIGVRPMVALLRSDEVSAPCAIGWLRPVVLVPVGAFVGLSPEDLELVLAHELAHIARSDFALNVAQRICEALLFFHPAARWASSVIRAERENCCDDVAARSAKSPVAYARALTELEALRVEVGGAPGHAVLSAVGGSLTDRVKRLVLPPSRHGSPRVAGASALTVLGTLAVIAPLAVGAIAHAHPEPARSSSPAAQSAASPATTSMAPLRMAPLTMAPIKMTPLTTEPIRMPRLAMLSGDDAASDRGAGDDEQGTTVTRAEPSRIRGHAGPLLAVATHEHSHAHSQHAKSHATESQVAPDDIVVQPADVDVDADPQPDPQPDPDPNPEADDEPLSRVDALVALKQAGVTPEYVQQLRAAGLNPSTRELVMMGRLGLTPERVKKLEAAFGTHDARELIRVAEIGVTPEYVEQLRALGFDHLGARDLVRARGVGLDAEYVKAMRAAGLDTKDFETLVRLRATGVDPAYVSELRKAGLEHLDAHQLASLRSVGVDADYVAQMKRLGLGALSVRELTQLRATGVTPDYVDALRKAGLDRLDVHQLASLRSVGVDTDYIGQMKRLGLDPLGVRELTRLRAMGVTPEYVESLRKAGLAHLNVDQLLHLRESGVDSKFIQDMNRAAPK